MHEQGLTIKEAAKRTGIPYPNAKAVNKTFEREKRTAKKHHKFLEIRNDSDPIETQLYSLTPGPKILNSLSLEADPLD